MLFNKKIELFFKIVEKLELTLTNYTKDLKSNLEKIRKIRNLFAHESFSYNKDTKKYTCKSYG